MRAHPDFSGQPKQFWAMVRTLSQHLGYVQRSPRGQVGPVAVHSVQAQAQALLELGLNSATVLTADGPTPEGLMLEAYFHYRADALNNGVFPALMDVVQAKALFEANWRRLYPRLAIPSPINLTGRNALCPIPMNKQSGDMKAPAYYTGLVNLLMREALGHLPCDFDPRELTTFTRNGAPVRTLARRVDGAFPGAVNPIALWEIKEYYYTTSFGSRVADGVYETLLDGLELEEMALNAGISAYHFLFIDARDTWWTKGRAYLCRIIDMLNMGYTTEVIFGQEAIVKIPEIARYLVADYNRREGVVRPGY